MDLVLDSAVFLSGRMTSMPSGFDSVYITELVRNEISRGRPNMVLQNLLELGLKVRGPSGIEGAVEAARSTGDLDLLSETDISIIALAMQLGNVKVLTDDFRIQNVLKSLNIDFEPAGEIGNRTIQETWEWTFRCKGCGRYFDERPGQDCPVCGSDIKKTRKRSM